MIAAEELAAEYEAPSCWLSAGACMTLDDAWSLPLVAAIAAMAHDAVQHRHRHRLSSQSQRLLLVTHEANTLELTMLHGLSSICSCPALSWQSATSKDIV